MPCLQNNQLQSTPSDASQKSNATSTPPRKKANSYNAENNGPNNGIQIEERHALNQRLSNSSDRNSVHDMPTSRCHWFEVPIHLTHLSSLRSVCQVFDLALILSNHYDPIAVESAAFVFKKCIFVVVVLSPSPHLVFPLSVRPWLLLFVRYSAGNSCESNSSFVSGWNFTNLSHNTSSAVVVGEDRTKS